jgi:hypothetical protein
MVDQGVIKEVKHLMEEVMDKEGLAQLVQLVAEICYEKAEHVLTNWQDKNLAKLWEKDAKLLERVVGAINIR